MKLASAILAGAALLAASAASAQDATGDAEAGAKVFKKCQACHAIDGKNKVGPHLDGVVGRVAGSVDGFKYSTGMQKLHDEGLVWDAANLTEYLPNPKGMVEKSKMTFNLKDPQDIADVIAYLTTLGS